MILGINWFREFPIELYDYKFFNFRRSPGGHADYPAELETLIQTSTCEQLVEQIQELVNCYKQARIFLKIRNNNLKIMIGWYSLFDFDFSFANEVERLLTKNNVNFSNEEGFTNEELLKLGNHNLYNEFKYPKIENSSIVYSSPGKNNAITSSLRIDCNVVKEEYNELIYKLNKIGDECNFNSIYISQKQSKSRDRENLSIFLTNGRQGRNLNEMIVSDGVKTEQMINNLDSENLIQFGQIGDWKFSPSKIKTIVRVEDKEYHNLLN